MGTTALEGTLMANEIADIIFYYSQQLSEIIRTM